MELHHINYDKSSSDITELILLLKTSNTKIRDPPKQSHFGSPICHTLESLEDKELMERAKKAFLDGHPPAHWSDPTSIYYNPSAVQKYSYRKLFVEKWGFYALLWFK